MSRQLIMPHLDRLFFVAACMLPSWPAVKAAGPSTNFNPCSSIASGFKGIDSTNRVTYVECQNYQVLQSLDCSAGFYFDEDTNQCVWGTWIDDSELLVEVDPHCSETFNGFVGLDSSNRVTYVECSNYVEIARYDCPSGFYFEQVSEICVEGVWSADQVQQVLPTSLQSETTLINGIVDIMDDTEASCDNISNGNVPLDSLRGYLVCVDGEELVREFCGNSQLYDTELGACTNYCDTLVPADISVAISDVILPKMGGSITCDNAARAPIETIVCSAGTHYDANSGFCRNFCLGTGNDGQMYYVSFSGNEGGASCQNQQLVSTIFCIAGTIYSTVRGICMQTDSPTVSPTSAQPTFSPVTDPPTLSHRPSLSMVPTEGLELVVEVPEEGEDEKEKKGKKRPLQVESSAFRIYFSSRYLLPICSSMTIFWLLAF